MKQIEITLEEVKIAYMIFMNISMTKLPLKTIFAIKKILLALEGDVNKANETAEELKTKYASKIEKAHEEGEDATKIVEDEINKEYIEWLRDEIVKVDFKPLPAVDLEDVEMSLVTANGIEKFLEF